MSQQLELDFENTPTEYTMILEKDGWPEHFRLKTSIPRDRLISFFSCQTIESVGICPRNNYKIQCDMASSCHPCLVMDENDPDWKFGKLCTVCFHDAITKLGEASWRLEDVC